MNLKEFRKATAHLPEDTQLFFPVIKKGKQTIYGQVNKVRATILEIKDGPKQEKVITLDEE